MLTKGTNHNEHDADSASIESEFDLFTSLLINSKAANDTTKGTLILAGEGEHGGDGTTNGNDELHLSLANSASLPSEITLENTVLYDADRKEAIRDVGDDLNIFTKNIDGIHVNHSALLAFLFLTTTIMACCCYISSQNEIIRLNQSLESQKFSLLPLAVLLSSQQRSLKNEISSLQKQLAVFSAEQLALSHKLSSFQEQLAVCNDNLFSHFNNNNNDTYTFENCYFKASLTPGSCYNDWQSWFHTKQQQTADHSDTGKEEEESDTLFQDNKQESFLSHLFESTLTKSSQSYSHVENGFKWLLHSVLVKSSQSYNYVEAGLQEKVNLFDNLDFVSLFNSSMDTFNHMYGDESISKEKSQVDLHETLAEMTKGIVDQGSAIAKFVETQTIQSLSSVLDYSSSWIKNVLD